MKKLVFTTVVPVVLALLTLTTAYSVEQKVVDKAANTIKIANLQQAKAMISHVRASHPDTNITLIIDDERVQIKSRNKALKSLGFAAQDSWGAENLRFFGLSGLHLSMLTIRTVEMVRVVIDESLMHIANSLSLTILGVEFSRPCVNVC